MTQDEAKRIATEGNDYETWPVGPFCYIASAYSVGDRSENVRVSIRTATELGDMGYCALSPLLNHIQDLMTPRPASHWLSQDLAIVERADVVLRLPGESRGADIEVAHAQAHGIPVVFSVNELLARFPPKRFR